MQTISFDFRPHPPRRHKTVVARMMRTAALVAAAAALSACQMTTGSEQTVSAPVAAASSIRASATAGPGPNPISAERARKVFNDLCVTKFGAPAKTEAAAAAYGFVKNTEFGTYYHPGDNLSVKLIDGECSMVFASRVAAGQLQSTLTSLSSGRQIVFRQTGTSAGPVPYYNVRIAAR